MNIVFQSESNIPNCNAKICARNQLELVRYETLGMNINNSKPRHQQGTDKTYNQETGCLLPFSYCFMISFLCAD